MKQVQFYNADNYDSLLAAHIEDAVYSVSVPAEIDNHHIVAIARTTASCLIGDCDAIAVHIDGVTYNVN